MGESFVTRIHSLSFLEMDLVQMFTTDYSYPELLDTLDFAIVTTNLLMESKFTFTLSMPSAFADSEKK